ncbi:hypothetical protein WMF27_10565 [Sorangium sp. So ce281]|uniref:hypothetical protein n=1 Tax=unclassified Sorangium TaxID=2621164 RepID=UPI003F60947A
MRTSTRLTPTPDAAAIASLSERAWGEIGNWLAGLPARSVPAVVRGLQEPLAVWPARLRVARSLDPWDPGGIWWTLGCRSGLRGRPANLVRCLVAGAPEVLGLSPDCGWSKAMHPDCDFRMLNLGEPADLTLTLRFLAELRGLDLSAAHPPRRARQAFVHSLQAGVIDRMHRLNLLRLELGPASRPFLPRGHGSQDLWSLELGMNGLSSALSPAVHRLAVPGGLRVLGIGGNEASLEQMRFLADDGFIEGLTHLDLGPNLVTGSDVHDLLRAGRPAGLQSLRLSGIEGIEQTLPELLDPALLPALRSLGLATTGLTGRGLRHLAESSMFGRLQEIDLAGNDFQDDDLESLLAVPRPAGLAVRIDEDGLAEQTRERLHQWLGSAPGS